MGPCPDRGVDQAQLLIQALLFRFAEFNPLICKTLFFLYHITVAGQSIKRGKLCSSVIQAHVWPGRGLPVRMIDDIRIHIAAIWLAFFQSFGHERSPSFGESSFRRLDLTGAETESGPALWPPICPFRRMVVAPSIRFIPFSTAFFPYFSWS